MLHDEVDPMEPWVRTIAAEHAAAHHVEGERCRGSIALIDEAARLRGIAQVRFGRAVSLQREIETRPGRLGDRRGPIEFDIDIEISGRSAHATDTVSYGAHGIEKTHLDGLAHHGADATWHGDMSVAASEWDEDTMVAWAKHGIATRAVLLDVTAVRGVEWIVSGEPVTGAELDVALAATGVALEPGDALLIYQGRDRYEAAGHDYPTGPAAYPRPGIGSDGAQWIASQQPGLVLWDFHDARCNPHGLLEAHSLIFAIGLCFIDNSNLGAAVRALAAASTATALLVAAPLAIHRSTGVLINPLILY